MRHQVTGHVVTHLLHVGAHLVESRSRYEVALAVDLPSDGRVGRADLVVAGGAGGRTGVRSNINAHVMVMIDDHTAGEVGVVVVVVVDGEDLPLHSHVIGKLCCSWSVASMPSGHRKGCPHSASRRIWDDLEADLL